MNYRSNLVIVVSRDILTVEAFSEPSIVKYYAFNSDKYFAYIIDFDYLVSKKDVVDMLSKEDVKGVVEILLIHTLYDALAYLEEFLIG